VNEVLTEVETAQGSVIRRAWELSELVQRLVSKEQAVIYATVAISLATDLTVLANLLD